MTKFFQILTIALYRALVLALIMIHVDPNPDPEKTVGYVIFSTIVATFSVLNDITEKL